MRYSVRSSISCCRLIPRVRRVMSRTCVLNLSRAFGAMRRSLPSFEMLNPRNLRSSGRGAVNLFVFLDAHRSWRRVKVTGRRTADDFALCMRELVDVDFPEAQRIRVVLDNLSTHTAAALYAAFPPA